VFDRQFHAVSSELGNPKVAEARAVRIQVGVAFDGMLPLPEAVEVARQAEAAGVHSLWVAEHMGYRESTLSAMAFLAATRQATVVPTAISPYVRNPTIAAMAGATLAEAGPGRAALCVGLGNPLFLQESGVTPERPVRAVAEYLECLRALWTGEAVRYDGQIFRLAGARLGFRLPSPVPIYVAAIKEQMLRLAGRAGDGVALSAGITPEYTAASLSVVAEGARAAGRDPASVRAAGYLLVAVSPDGREAIEACRAKLAFLLRNKFLADNVRRSGLPVDQGAIIAAVARRDMAAATRLVSDDAVEAFTVAGTPAACRARLEAFVRAGLREPVLAITGSPVHRPLALDLARAFAA
jgi:5,10-methylenetetrahydromethanopterin reductase